VKKRRNWHRHDYTELDDGSKPVQAGTRTFIKQLRARSFPRYRSLLTCFREKNRETLAECVLEEATSISLLQKMKVEEDFLLL